MTMWWRFGQKGGTQLPTLLPLVAGLLVLAALIAGCAQSGAASGATPTTGGGVFGGPTPTLAPDLVTPTPLPVATTGAGGQIGIAAFCTQPVNVSSQLPASIPVYPNAQLRVGQAQGSFALYGLCTSDGTSAVTSFYIAQLPQKGWGQVTHTTTANTEQLFATKGGAHLIITISPDGQAPGTTDIIISSSGT